MKTRKITNFAAVLGKEPPAIRVPEELPKLPMLLAAYGVRGSGKSVSITTMLRKYKEANLLQRAFLISPTYGSNAHLFSDLVAPEDIYSETNQASLDAILESVASEAAEYKLYREHKLLFEEYTKQKKQYIAGKRKEIDSDLLFAVYQCGLADMETFPKYKYDTDQTPQMWLILDDCQSGQLFLPSTKTRKNLSSVMIAHRHWESRFGLNIVIALQNFKAQTGTLARAMRANLTCMCLFGYRDEKLLESIHDEIGREVTKEEFYDLFDYATSGEKWNHLTIEFGNPIRFRKNWDTFLFPEKKSLDNDSEDDRSSERSSDRGSEQCNATRSDSPDD